MFRTECHHPIGQRHFACRPLGAPLCLGRPRRWRSPLARYCCLPGTPLRLSGHSVESPSPLPGSMGPRDAGCKGVPLPRRAPMLLRGTAFSPSPLAPIHPFAMTVLHTGRSRSRACRMSLREPWCWEGTGRTRDLRTPVWMRGCELERISTCGLVVEAC